MILALLAALAAPQPGEIKTFQDWTVGCDNVRICQAVALIPEDEADKHLIMVLRRSPEPDARPIVTLETGDDAAAALSLGGRKLPLRLQGGRSAAMVAAADTAQVIELLRTQPSVDVLDASDGVIGRVSLAGASAALLYIDEKQQRRGTVTALFKPGQRPASAVPPPPRAPQVRDATRPRSRAHTLSPQREAQLRTEFGCTLTDVGGAEGHEAIGLDRKHTLILIPCGAGAYNVSFVPLIATGSRRNPVTRLAHFDVSPGMSDEGPPMIVNAVWAEGRLSAYAKGRGIGDCGVASSYAWDGGGLRLVEQSEMHECRGSIAYITTWRAEVVR